MDLKKLRRVVTGHDSEGRAKVLIDETVTNVFLPRPGAGFIVIWSSEGFPVNNEGDEDPSNNKAIRSKNSWAKSEASLQENSTSVIDNERLPLRSIVRARWILPRLPVSPTLTP
jgi:hypothetical protein